MAVDKLLLGSHLEVLLQKLSDGAAMDLARRLTVDCDFKEMWMSLLLVAHVLEDAKPVNIRLEELRDLAYDLEDVVDEFTTLALIQDVKKGIQHTKNSMVRKLILTCSNFTPMALVSNRRLVSTIKDIRKKLNNISEKWSDWNLRNFGGLSSRSAVMRSESTSQFMEYDVYGRDEDKKAIKEILLRVESSTKNFTVIPIVGMGGIGKTALAQLLYNDEDVKRNFDVRVWVHVSQEFDVLKITKKIHQAVTKVSGNWDMDLAMLQLDLHVKIVNIKFFIVLDDVWNENSVELHDLCSHLSFGLSGSKIIFTTRSHVVASVVASAQSAYHMKLLTDEECQSTLAQHAQISFQENSHLQEVVRGLANMCKGLPFWRQRYCRMNSIKSTVNNLQNIGSQSMGLVVGGVLRSKNSKGEWKNVLSSKIWRLSKENILPILRLSYQHLPSHLRLPFAYCSVFPKDYEFDQNELVHLWMGEGFLDVPNERKSKKDLGHQYFKELLSRSFFQRKSGGDSKFVMHDLISELAHFVSGGVCYCLDDKLDTDQDHQLPKKIRHASFLGHECEHLLEFEGFRQIKGLRTFLPMPVQNSLSSPPFHLSNRILVEMIPRLHSLRTLSLSGYSITELPSSICNLILLRYLNLSGTLIVTLPPSVSGLLSLEFLSLSDCRLIHKLPSTLGDLSNLCHLDISNTDRLKDLPVEISRLLRLQILPKIILGGVGNFGLKELRWLKHLRGTFAIFELQNVANLDDAREAGLWYKSEIEDLQLSWGSTDPINSQGISHEDVIDKLEPHYNLRKLKIESYKGVNFPDWIGDPLYAKLSSLSLSNCTECTSLPPLGLLPELKHVHIGGMPRIKCIGTEFYGRETDVPFQRLETLRFEHMSELEKWSARSEESMIHFPLLHRLTMFKCDKLNDVAPMSLPFLSELDTEGCNIVLLKDKGKYWPKVAGKIDGNNVHQQKN